MIFSVQLDYFLSLFWQACDNCICLTQKQWHNHDVHTQYIFYWALPTFFGGGGGGVGAKKRWRNKRILLFLPQQKNSKEIRYFEPCSFFTPSLFLGFICKINFPSLVAHSHFDGHTCHICYLAFSVVSHKMRSAPQRNLPHWPRSIIT